jgi:hypothetical protein
MCGVANDSPHAPPPHTHTHLTYNERHLIRTTCCVADWVFGVLCECSCHPDERWRKALVTRDPRYVLVAATESTGAALHANLSAVPEKFEPDLTLSPLTSGSMEPHVLGLLTVMLGVAAAKLEIVQRWCLPGLVPGESSFAGTLDVHFIGARPIQEAMMQFDGVATLAMMLLKPEVNFTRVRVLLVGPEMADLDADMLAHHRECERQIAARDLDGLSLEVHTSTSLYHDSPPPAPHLAFVLNGGIDSGYADWAPTLRHLLVHDVPTVFTGYTATHGCDDSAGCIRILKLMGADVTLPPSRNPFRFKRYARITGAESNGFLIVARGRVASAPPLTDARLAEVQRLDRIEKLEELAKVNEIDNPHTSSSANLRRLRDALVASTVTIPMDVTTEHLEGWAHGSTAPRWSGGPEWV